MKAKFWITLILIALMVLPACQTAAATRQSVAPSFSPAATAAPALPATAGGARAASEAAQPADVTQMVIKNADLSIVVEDPAAGMAAISKMASDMGGYVVTSRLFKTRTESGIEVPQANITIRIPAEKLDDGLAKIRALTKDPAKDIRSENVTGKDVTGDYIDLQSRLTNLENTEKQLQKIQESATKTDDVLAVFNRITEIRQEIEQIKGQMKYYREAAALSSVAVTLVSKESVAPLSIGGWEPVGIARDALQALINVGKALVEILIWLVIFFAPLGLVLYFPGRWLWKRFRRWQQAHPKAAPPVYPPMAYPNQASQYPPAAQPPYTPPPQTPPQA